MFCFHNGLRKKLKNWPLFSRRNTNYITLLYHLVVPDSRSFKESLSQQGNLIWWDAWSNCPQNFFCSSIGTLQNDSTDCKLFISNEKLNYSEMSATLSKKWVSIFTASVSHWPRTTKLLCDKKVNKFNSELSTCIGCKTSGVHL